LQQNDDLVPSDPGPEPCLDLPHFHFSVEKVERSLLALETNKGGGLDGIPLIILKNCATAFALPLCLIFNNAISTCVFPDKWKLLYVTPIFKNYVTNYREIAVLSAIAKLSELLINKNMYKDLQRLISVNQHGYVKGRSTVSNLLEYGQFSVKTPTPVHP
jgi:hypothetical protein